MSDNPTHWKPGQSGNPSGRTKNVGRLRDLARKHTEDAVATLVEIMLDKKAAAAARVNAAGHILDRGWGKAPQEIKIEGELDVRSLSDAALDKALKAELAAFIGGEDQGADPPQDQGKPH